MEYKDEDYYSNAVIKPPKDFTYFDNNTRLTRIIIDSSIRNKKLYPNPNDYEIAFEDDINDVISSQLIYIDIPMPQYLINNNFNTLYFMINSNKYEANIQIGDYTPSELAIAITNAMNDVMPSTFNITYNAKLDNFNFNATVAFTLLFNNISNSLCYLLGFSSIKDYTSVLDINNPSYPNLISSAYRKNFDYNNYVIMNIDQFDLMKSIDRNLNKSFAIIPKNYTSINICDSFDIIKKFSPPIARMTKVRVKFYDKYGNPYDFQNMDHRFELLMNSFKQRVKYRQ